MVLYSIQGTVISKIDNSPVPFATVEIFEVDRIGIDYRIDLIATTNPALTDMDGRFFCSFDYPSPPRPDIIFRISQNISGVTQYIYNESPAFHTRWSIADVMFVNLRVEEYCITSHAPGSSRPATDYFIFTRVGNIGVDSISQTTGYAYPDIDPGPPNVTQSNLPFGRTLWIAGWFGSLLPPFNYYKIQYSPGVHSATDAGPWNDIYDSLSNSYFDTTPPISHWITENMGPFTDAGISNLYKPPDHMDVKPWVFPDLLIRWDTTKVTDGLYTVRVLGYSISSGVASPVSLNPEPVYGTLKLIIDNTPPEYGITKITHRPASDPWSPILPPVEPCEIKTFDGILSVEFKAHDPKGHLRRYSLIPHYGHNSIVVPSPTLPDKAEDEYANHIASLPDPQNWFGSTSLRTEYRATPPEPDSTGYNSIEMPPCAYQFRLVVDKRTTNGYGLIYYAYEDNWHITLTRV